eukprot:5490362-Amphidinium_carterae.1
MRGFWRYDMIHKEWGDTINALTSANLSNFKVALQVTVNFGGGPWGTATDRHGRPILLAYRKISTTFW